MPDLTHLATQLVVTVLLADFTSGFVHWAEDAYGREDWPITGRLFTQPNTLHHREPRYFVRHTWWQSSWDITVFAAVVVLVAWWRDALTWQVWLYAFLGANANQVHKWAHRSRAENGPIIDWLQRISVLQTAEHHAHHHTDPKNSHYCVLTNVVNPVLDGLGFWSGLERLIERVTGARRRVDLTVRSDFTALERRFDLQDSAS